MQTVEFRDAVRGGRGRAGHPAPASALRRPLPLAVGVVAPAAGSLSEGASPGVLAAITVRPAHH